MCKRARTHPSPGRVSPAINTRQWNGQLLASDLTAVQRISKMRVDASKGQPTPNGPSVPADGPFAFPRPVCSAQVSLRPCGRLTSWGASLCFRSRLAILCLPCWTRLGALRRSAASGLEGIAVGPQRGQIFTQRSGYVAGHLIRGDSVVNHIAHHALGHPQLAGDGRLTQTCPLETVVDFKCVHGKFGDTPQIRE